MKDTQIDQMPAELRELVSAIIPGAEMNLKRSAQLMPVCLLKTRLTGMQLCGLDFTNPGTKLASRDAVRALSEAYGGTAAVFVAESLQLEVKDPAEAAKWAGRLSEHPDAIDVVSINAETCDEAWLGIAEVSKDRVMGPIRWQRAGEEYRGEMTNFLGNRSRHNSRSFEDMESK